MESVLSRWLEVDIGLLHVLGLVLLHELIPFSFRGYHLVTVVPN